MNSVPIKTFPTSMAAVSSLCLFLILSPITLPEVAAQPANNNNSSSSDMTSYANFSPSMAIIIVVLVAALFFMGFFSIYIRHCSDPNSGNTVRNGILSAHARRAIAASRGLDRSVIDTFPTFTYAEVKDQRIGKGALECAVCLNEFEETETLRLIPKCDHVFHPECIDAWLESHVTCPVCRANLNDQPGEAGTFQIPEGNSQENPENNTDGPMNDGDVPVQVVCENPPERQETVRGMNRNLSFDPNRTTRNGSVRRGRGVFGFGRFRSHSTGHSLVQRGENVERFTLRLPEEKRKEMMNRALLNRTKSYVTQSSRKGYRTDGIAVGDGSNRGGRSYRRIEPLDRDQAAQSDRWVFSRMPSFLTRALSIRSPRDNYDNNNGEGSTSSKPVKTTVRMPSIKCLEPKAADETGLVEADSARPPV